MNRTMKYIFTISGHPGVTITGTGTVTIVASNNEIQDKKVLLLRAKTLEAKKFKKGSNEFQIEVKQISLED